MDHERTKAKTLPIRGLLTTFVDEGGQYTHHWAYLPGDLEAANRAGVIRGLSAFARAPPRRLGGPRNAR